jgi:hypothetical protein
MRFLSVMVLSSAVLGAQDHAGQCTRSYTPAKPVTARNALYSTVKPAVCSHDSRVVAVLSDGPVRIVSPARMDSIAEDELADGTCVVRCDELEVVPGTEAGADVALRCVGHVLVKTKRFSARAGRMSKEADRLVLEADGATKARLIRLSSSTDDERAFTVTGERITLSLSLDHISVGGGTVIKLAAPALPDSTVQTSVPR